MLRWWAEVFYKYLLAKNEISSNLRFIEIVGTFQSIETVTDLLWTSEIYLGNREFVKLDAGLKVV